LNPPAAAAMMVFQPEHATNRPGIIMMIRSSAGVGRRRRVGPWVLMLPFVALGCDNESTPRNGGAASTSGGAVKPARPLVGAAAPSFKVSITDVETNWRDKQQTFVMTLTNTGDRVETVHALVYGRNEDVNPPRRAISPATATDWFKIAESEDGRLTALDIEKSWKTNAFYSARGNTLKHTWEATVPPGRTKTLPPMHHDLDDTSPFPATKGKRLAKAGFTEYQVWLFTAEGRWFLEKTIAAKEAGTRPKNATLPSFKVGISKVKTSWRDKQQTFSLTLTNTGENAETVHALVYGRNEEINPPRRAISPATATDWFKLA
jgi:hypothetical protein